MKHTAVILLVLITTLYACKDKDAATGKKVEVFIPANFPPMEYNLDNNPVTDAGFVLGRKLFYDPILSRDNTISCGSCHIQYSAFTQHGHAVSHGIDDLQGKRNSLPIQNLLWSRTFFWDGGVHNLDLVPINPIENDVEMDETFGNVLQKLRDDPDYPPMFKAAFGSEEISSQTMLRAMSQFMGTLVSANSRYDKYVRNEGGTLTAQEQNGLQLFRLKCASCHSTDLFSDNGFHNNGLSTVFNDKGRYDVTLVNTDVGKFKTPSLRNVEKTQPYMHDGRFTTLQQVLNHYSTGVQQSATLDTLLQQNGTLGIPLTQGEKDDIIAFLKTLTDDEFIRNTLYSEQ